MTSNHNVQDRTLLSPSVHLLCSFTLSVCDYLQFYSSAGIFSHTMNMNACPCVCVCECECVCVCLYVCMPVYVHARARVCVSVSVCMHPCMLLKRTN